MWTVFLMQWKRVINKPTLILLLLGMTILMVNVVAGTQGNSGVTVNVYSDVLNQEDLAEKVTQLNQNDTIHFVAKDAEKISDDIRLDKYSYALSFEEDNYQLLVGRETANLSLITQYVSRFYSENNRLNAIGETGQAIPSQINEPIKLTTKSLENIGSEIVDLSVVLGLTFYFTIFSILYLMTNLVEEKKNGIWNRLIFSPVSKTKIYVGHLLFYFSIGVLQVLISMVILMNMLSLNLDINYAVVIMIILAFLLSIVSLGILLTALVKTISSLQVIIPIVTTSMAMLGGAFWPLQVVDNQFLRSVAEFMPIKQAIYGIVESFIQNKSFLDSMQPVGILLIMSLLFMGIGINLMERVTESPI
ncbi:ABC transporter permease [Marinilactibacillus kalidii]|uniref:ABC transporter permease n=1 Tax=Marinilactibacillus kalidii TaxID=2820274 RepID=UPI001ABE7B47|nr:ABC transporter permease [Marinilactibacillus kalidii]